MRLPRWIGRVLAPKQGTTRSRNRARVHLEVLEDRCVPANHAPVGTAATLTIPQNMPYTLATTDFGFTDPNDLPANNLSAVKITTLPTVGYLANNGMPVGAGQSVSVADIVANHLVYSPDLMNNGPASLTFQVQDDGGIADGGVDLDPSPKTLTMIEGSSSNPPTLTFSNPGDQENQGLDAVYLHLTASSSSNSTLQYSAAGLPAGLTIYNSAIMGTIDENDGADYSTNVTITATDPASGANTSVSFVWLVQSNTNYHVSGTGDTGQGAGNIGDLRYCINRINMSDASQAYEIDFVVRGNTTDGTITLGSALPTMTRRVLIFGTGAYSGLSISGAGQFHIFSVGADARVSLDGLMITNGVGAASNWGLLRAYALKLARVPK